MLEMSRSGVRPPAGTHFCQNQRLFGPDYLLSLLFVFLFYVQVVCSFGYLTVHAYNSFARTIVSFAADKEVRVVLTMVVYALSYIC